MTCRAFADFLAAYLAGELPAEVLARFERHITVCPNCERYLAQYRESILLGRAAFADANATVPADVPEDLIGAILTARTMQ
jgi:anti-sigma factor RsiW